MTGVLCTVYGAQVYLSLINSQYFPLSSTITATKFVKSYTMLFHTYVYMDSCHPLDQNKI